MRHLINVFSAYRNSSLLAKCGGVQVIIQYIIQCHNSPRINEALLQTALYLLNHSQTRQWCSLCGLDVSAPSHFVICTDVHGGC